MQQVDIAITNGLIVTVNKDDKVIKNGYLIIDRGQIIDIGVDDKILEKYRPTLEIKADKKLIMPGLINTHTHAAMNIYRGFADDMPLKEWLNDYVFPYEAKYTTEHTIKSGTELAVIEMIKSGTTFFNNMYFYEDIAAQVAKKTGIKALLNEGLLDFPTPNMKTPKEGLSYIEMLVNKYKNDELVKIGVAPHAPYTCSPELIKEAKKLSDKYQIPLHIHLSETQWEFDNYIEKFGQTPTEYLESLNVLDKNVIAAHAVHLTDKDIEIMKKYDVGVAHNPECNMKLVSGIAPIPKMQKAGIKVGLATDGVASNNNLDLFQEMRSAAFIHKINSQDPTVADAKSIVRMATIDAAKVVGMDSEIGSLERGKKADITIIDLHKPHLVPLYNIYSQIVYSMSGQDVDTVIINGKVIMQNRNMLTINENEVMTKNQAIADVIINENEVSE